MLPAVVLTPLVQKRSLTAMGIPGKRLFNFGFLSKFLDSFSADSEHFVTKEFNFLSFSIFFIKDLVSSSDLISFF